MQQREGEKLKQEGYTIRKAGISVGKRVYIFLGVA
jgi:hypothetical protein